MAGDDRKTHRSRQLCPTRVVVLPGTQASEALGCCCCSAEWLKGDSCRAWRSTERRRRRSCRDEAAGAPVEGGLDVFGAARLPPAPRGGGRGRPRRRRTVTAFSEPAT